MENYSCSINNEHLYSIGTNRVRYAINYMYGFVKQFLASEASIIFGLWSHYTFPNSFLYMRLCIVNFVLMVVAKYLRYGKIASCGLVLFVRRFSSFSNKNYTNKLVLMYTNCICEYATASPVEIYFEPFY